MSLAICHYIIVPYMNADVISPLRVSHIDEVPFLKAEFLPLTTNLQFFSDIKKVHLLLQITC